MEKSEENYLLEKIKSSEDLIKIYEEQILEYKEKLKTDSAKDIDYKSPMESNKKNMEIEKETLRRFKEELRTGKFKGMH